MGAVVFDVSHGVGAGNCAGVGAGAGACTFKVRPASGAKAPEELPTAK